MEPPDPGGTAPPASYYVTISNESGMETDSSTLSQSRKLKRSRLTKVCKHCNKKKRKHINNDTIHSLSDCNCTDHDQTNKKAIHEFSTNPVMPSETSAGTAVTSSKASEVSTVAESSHPPLVSRKLYSSSDAAPFIVHVQKIQTSDNDGTILHPVTFGKFLKKNSFQRIINGSVKKIGRNRVSLAFEHFDSANVFLSHESIASNKFKAFIPSFNITRMGVIRGVPADWTIDEVKQNITVPMGCGEILKVRRINYKVIVDGNPIWKPTQTVILTFDGQVLPKRIFMCYNALPVELYTFPTIQCFNCCRYGHTKLQCRSKPKCFRCGQGHSGATCTVEEDHACCCMCSGYHFATNKTCPEFIRQKEIKSSMAKNCISYSEAAKLHPASYKLYSEVLRHQSDSQTKNVYANSNEQNHNIPTRPQYPNSLSHSYNKTVFLKPRSLPKSVKGYDRSAHEALTKDYSFTPSSNGCALNNSNDSQDVKIQQSLPDIIAALINALSQFNLIPPSNVATVIESVLNTSSLNGSTTPNNTSVELPKRSQ